MIKALYAKYIGIILLVLLTIWLSISIPENISSKDWYWLGVTELVFVCISLPVIFPLVFTVAGELINYVNKKNH